MKIAVLVSGGVDSSVALRLLKEQGHELKAFYLKIWLEDELAHLGDCPWEDDLEIVRNVCEQADVPLEVLSLQKDYWDSVVQYTLDEVAAGRTPNPDIMCNQTIKFGRFYEKIDDSYEKVATGHYAWIEEKEGIFSLKKSPDLIKDQTYFLSRLNQKQLSRALFPLGEYTKEEVRELARKYDLPNQNRKDSQGICFLGKFKFKDFLKYHLGERPGDIIEFETGEKQGDHLGFWYYTVGQRKGLDLSGGPWFVVKKDPQKNIVYISRNYHAEDKNRDELTVSDINWTSDYGPPLNNPVQLNVKLRHGPEEYRAEVLFRDKRSAHIKLPESDQGIAAGQFAVFYDDSVCLGGGIIDEKENL